MSRPTKRLLAGSPANYWDLDYGMLTNAQVVIHPVDRSVFIPTFPHWACAGTVIEILHEDDGDHHMWLRPDGYSKDRLACEFTPWQPLPLPKVGQHIRVYGILRWDAQHSWYELHPLDGWEAL